MVIVQGKKFSILKKEFVHLFLWWLKPRLWLVDLNYNFKCDWLILTKTLNVIGFKVIELSDNKVSVYKLSDNIMTSELVGKRSFFKPTTIEEIVIFMITLWILRHEVQLLINRIYNKILELNRPYKNFFWAKTSVALFLISFEKWKKHCKRSH